MAKPFTETFEIILEETSPVIRAYLAGMGVPPCDVDDLAQDVYVNFYKSGGQIPADSSPIRWLKGIAPKIDYKTVPDILS